MKGGLETYHQLEHRNDLLQEVIDQLNKDFGSKVIEISWNKGDDNPYGDFLEQVEKQVLSLLKNDKQAMMSILYRIDVFESKLRVVWTLDKEDQPKKMTELILNRELQKVLTRRWYKQK
jgi:hypothetical protein